ncbi:hypothetical protein Bhyg_12086 [Pseudolycoriella hygida]|uniref:Uncharacterized protein n=1 Tax=Pseudolycoriella hygida TaxID=35572 RepID=A0A9Q0MYX5_9DIPT|nr:hypothetical protein Bhyg_12086 [Pseudolycoriella hygida]
MGPGYAYINVGQHYSRYRVHGQTDGRITDFRLSRPTKAVTGFLIYIRKLDMFHPDPAMCSRKSNPQLGMLHNSCWAHSHCSSLVLKPVRREIRLIVFLIYPSNCRSGARRIIEVLLYLFYATFVTSRILTCSGNLVWFNIKEHVQRKSDSILRLENPECRLYTNTKSNTKESFSSLSSSVAANKHSSCSLFQLLACVTSSTYTECILSVSYPTSIQYKKAPLMIIVLMTNSILYSKSYGIEN